MPETTNVTRHPLPQPRSVRWPVTVAVVLVGWCLLAWTVFAAAINTAPFFGDTPSRGEYVDSGMACLTAVLPLALLVTLGLLWGSRWGLLALAVPALALLPLGASMLAEPGDSTDPGYGRGVQASDAFSELSHLNWGAALLLLLVVVAVVLARRRTARGEQPPTT